MKQAEKQNSQLGRDYKIMKYSFMYMSCRYLIQNIEKKHLLAAFASRVFYLMCCLQLENYFSTIKNPEQRVSINYTVN